MPIRVVKVRKLSSNDTLLGITIPMEFSRKMNLHVGDYMMIIMENGKLTMRKTD